jgi:hypothetical protein
MQYTTGPAWLQEGGYIADTFESLAEIGLAQLRILGPNSEIVCGPISTGGLGDAVKNFQVFNATISALTRLGYKIFNQAPYESGLGKLRQKWEQAGNTGYCTPILTEFYLKLFETGLITVGHFIPGWESSFGATWEHDEMQRLGVKINYLTPEWIASLGMVKQSQ